MNAWVIINLLWTIALLINSVRLYSISRAFERDRQKISQWNEKQQRKQRQL